jgi:peptide/nickel transport system substrate-binding protein
VFVSFLVLAFVCTLPAAGDEVAGVTSPNVGIKPMSADQYKPVIGKFGGRIVRDTLGEPKSFNPITAGETSTTEYTGRIFQGLTDIDPFSGDIRPLLAEKWEVAPDGLTWTFHLRHDVTFNDRTPFTAADVVFTWNDVVYDNTRPTGAEPRWPCSTRDATTFEGKTVKVEAVDDYTVRFTTPVKIAIWDQLVAESITLSKRKYAPLVANGSFGGALGSDSKPEDLVGTGPFMLESYERGKRVTLKRNPHFWKKDAAGQSLPYLDEEVFPIVRDLNTMLLDFEQGITDVYGIRSGKDVARLKPKQDEGKFSLYQFGPNDGDLFLCLNQNLDAAKQGKVPDYKIKWFRDQRFRQAISLAIDRGAQVRNILRNLGYPEAAPMTLAAGPYRQEGFAPLAFDPAKAKALLTDMGLKPGPDGILQDDQGHQVSFTINTNSGNDIREQTADFIRKDLENIGVKANVLSLEFNLLIDKMDSSHEWEGIVMGLTGGREPHWGSNVWKSSGRLHMWWPDQKSPSTDWEKQIDDVFFQGIQEMDKTKRKALYRQWVEIAYQQQPFIYLTVGEDAAALRRKFGNIFPAPIGQLFHNEEEIFVTEP